MADDLAFTEFGDERDEWDHDNGGPGVSLFGNALQVWAICQRGDVTVGQAAAAFRVPVTMIVQAVEAHYWMFLAGTGPIETHLIEHEGE